jgi:chromosome segregation ATPase
MQKIKMKILMLSILVLGLTSITLAQKPHHAKAHNNLESLSEELNLTEGQIEQLKEIKEAHRNSMKSAKEKMKSDLESVLTDEQNAKLKKLKEEKRAERKALHNEMKAYRKENIRPVMLEQRKKLENYLSEEDKEEIAALRAERKAHYREMKSQRGDMKGERERPNFSEEKKEKMKAQKERVRKLVEKYDSDITQLLEEIDGEKKKWKEDMKEIREERIEKSDISDKKVKHKMHRAKGMNKGHFLLMDPDSSEKEWSLDKNVGSFKVYPVPSSESNTVEYEVKQGGNIRIVLMDNQGNIMREISNEYQNPGVYEKEVDISDLSSKQYYYAILDDKGAVTKKFTVIK